MNINFLILDVLLAFPISNQPFFLQLIYKPNKLPASPFLIIQFSFHKKLLHIDMVRLIQNLLSLR